MIHDTVGGPRRRARLIGALSAPLLAVIGGSLPNAASAGSGVLGGEPEIRGSYCNGSDEDSAPSRPGCARIKGYITAGEHYGSDERIGGSAGAFAPLGRSRVAPGVPGFKIVGAPSGDEPFLPTTSLGDIAR